MQPFLTDLLRHQAWADAKLWHAIEAHAKDDTVLRERLHHIHLVQRAFTWIVGDRSSPLELSTPADFSTWEDLKAFARGAHDGIDRLLASLTDDRLQQRVVVEWFKDPPLQLTVGEALTQCAMHSQWHRGQNAARLRELGGVPPTVDLIVWFWKGRPAPSWDPARAGAPGSTDVT